jgi:hypothetical protein
MIKPPPTPKKVPDSLPFDVAEYEKKVGFI